MPPSVRHRSSSNYLAIPMGRMEEEYFDSCNGEIEQVGGTKSITCYTCKKKWATALDIAIVSCTKSENIVL